MRARSDLDQGMHAGAACRPACVGFAPCPPVAALPEHGRADKSAQRQGGQRAAQPVPHVRGIRRPDKKPCSPRFYTIGGRSRQSRTAATGNGGEKADRQMLSSLSSACRARTLIPPPYWPLSFSTPPPLRPSSTPSPVPGQSHRRLNFASRPSCGWPGQSPAGAAPTRSAGRGARRPGQSRIFLITITEKATDAAMPAIMTTKPTSPTHVRSSLGAGPMPPSMLAGLPLFFMISV